jgi:uncharacterized protein (TIGR04255 family)
MIARKKARPAMAFPERARVIYKVNPLEEVICQLRFPPLLRIESETPVAFQERIRGRFPFYKRNIGLPVPPIITPGKGVELAIGPQQNYEFGSQDEHWTLALSGEFLTLTCKHYLRWEEFRETIGQCLAPFLEVYSPSFFVRIGLRYRNLIRRSRLGLQDVDWSELVSPWIAGAYSAPELRGDVQHCFLQSAIRLPDDRGRVLMTCGTAKEGPSSEECYVIDADFSTHQHTESTNAIGQLDFLNVQSGRFFRWCISDHLHNALISGHSV